MSAGLSPSHPVFFITHEFFPKRGGIATFTEEIARATTQLGLQVEVWAQSGESPREVQEKKWPFLLRRLPMRGTHDLACQAAMARQLVAQRRRLRYATVYLPEPGPMLAMMFLQYFAAFRPRKLVLTFHGSEILRFHRNPLLRHHTRRLIQNATRISTLTRYTRDLLCERFPDAAGKTLLTPGALRADFAVVDPDEATDVAASPTRPVKTEQRLIILTVGRLHPRKGQLHTLAALKALAPRFRKRIEYWLVGDCTKSRYAAALQRAAAEADFPIRFLGNTPDDELERIYRQADIFAMTSIDYRQSIEGFGLVYLEAAAHGLPIVAHAVGGVPEAVTDGVNGLLVPPHRPAQLAAAFEKLVSEETLRHRLGDAGRTWARRNCWRESASLLFQSSGDTPSPL